MTSSCTLPNTSGNASSRAASTLATAELEDSATAASSGAASKLATAELDDSATSASYGAASKLAAAELEEVATAASSGAASTLATAELGGSATATGGRCRTFCTCVGTRTRPYLLAACRAVHGLFVHTWNLYSAFNLSSGFGLVV